MKIYSLLISAIVLISACNSNNQLVEKDNSQTNTLNQTIEKMDNMKDYELATLGGGCFWCVEAIYLELKGVEKVVSGYAGGKIKNPSYREISAGTTGHAEVIQVTYDPKVISYAEVLEIFWHSHDPTTLNRQGNDVGTQYRSAIFYHNEEQKAIAEKSLKDTDASDLWDDPIVTEIAPLDVFYKAEDYHQNYYNLNRDKNPYCSIVIAPKLVKFREKFEDKLKE